MVSNQQTDHGSSGKMSSDVTSIGSSRSVVPSIKDDIVTQSSLKATTDQKVETGQDEKSAESNGVPKIVLCVTGNGVQKKYRCQINSKEESKSVKNENSEHRETRFSRHKKLKALRHSTIEKEPNNCLSKEPVTKSDTEKVSDSKAVSESEVETKLTTVSCSENNMESLSSVKTVNSETHDKNVIPVASTSKTLINEIPNHKILLNSSRFLGKPTAHVEPYGVEPHIRSRSRKGLGFYDETIPLLVEHEEASTTKNSTDEVPNLQTHSHTMTGIQSKVSGDDEGQKQSTSSTNNFPNEHNTGVHPSTNEMYCAGRSKLQKYLQSLEQCDSRRFVSTEDQNCSSKTDNGHEGTVFTQTIAPFSILYRSLSMDSFFPKPTSSFQLRHSKSNYELSSTFDGQMLIGCERHNRISPSFVSYSETLGSADLSKDQGYACENVDTDSDDHPESLCIDEDAASLQYPKSRGRYKHKYSHEHDKCDEFRKRRRDKRREQQTEEGTVIAETATKNQVLHEREKGKRLAQEIPRFNWLEEKIRSSKDPSSTNAISHDGGEIISRRSSISSSSSMELTQQPSKPLPALIPSSEFTSLSRPNGAGYSPLSSPPPTSTIPTTETEARHQKYITPTHEPTLADAMGTLKRTLQETIPLVESQHVAQCSPPHSSDVKDQRCVLETKDSTGIHLGKIQEFSRKAQTESSQESTQTSVSVSEKMSLLTKAFKEKLNNCIPTTKVTGDQRPASKTFPLGMKSPVSAYEYHLQKDMNEVRFQLKPENSVNTSQCSHETRNNYLEMLLQKLKHSDPDASTMMSIMIELFLQTQKEIEKLRKSQEKLYEAFMISNKFNNYNPPATNDLKQKPEERPVIIDLEKHASSKILNQKKSPEEAENYLSSTSSKRPSTDEGYETMNKKARSSTSPIQDNTITIRYTLPSKSEKSENFDKEQTNSQLRNYLGIHNNALDVVPVGSTKNCKRGPLSEYIVPPSSSSSELEKNRDQGVVLMKLLENEHRPKHALPDLPSLIPSGSCPPSYKNVSDELESKRLSPKTYISQHNQEFETKNCKEIPRHQVSGEEEKARKGYVMPLGHLRQDHHSKSEDKRSSHHMLVGSSPNNIRKYSEENYNSSKHYQSRPPSDGNREDPSKYMPTKIVAPAPQTFQPRILIHSHDKESQRQEWSPGYSNPSEIQSSSRGASYSHPKSQGELGVNDYMYGTQKPQGIPANVRSGWVPPRPKTGPQFIPNNSKTVNALRHPAPLPSSVPHNAMMPAISSSRGSYYCAPVGYQQRPYGHQTATVPLQSNSNASHPKSESQPVSMYIQIPKHQLLHNTQAKIYPQSSKPQELPQNIQVIRPPSKPTDSHRIKMSVTHSPNNAHHSMGSSYDRYPSRSAPVLSYKVPEAPREEPATKLTQYKPTVENVSQKLNNRKCFICDQMAQFLCSGCKLAWYCSKECQREHWTAHSPTCIARR